MADQFNYKLCSDYLQTKEKKRMNTKEYSREMVDKLDEKNTQIKTIVYLFRCIKHSFIFQNLTYNNTIQQLREKER